MYGRGDLSKDERKAYIKSVLCLLSTPSKLPAAKFPGAKSRYDDFLVVHMQQTPTIHGTVSHLSSLENLADLPRETSCPGTDTSPGRTNKLFVMNVAIMELNRYVSSPVLVSKRLTLSQYWDWGRWAADPESSPIFDGSDTSMGGNGKKISHKASAMAPAQNGGGCVEKGPFAK